MLGYLVTCNREHNVFHFHVSECDLVCDRSSSGIWLEFARNVLVYAHCKPILVSLKQQNGRILVQHLSTQMSMID